MKLLKHTQLLKMMLIPSSPPLSLCLNLFQTIQHFSDYLLFLWQLTPIHKTIYQILLIYISSWENHSLAHMNRLKKWNQGFTESRIKLDIYPTNDATISLQFMEVGDKVASKTGGDQSVYCIAHKLIWKSHVDAKIIFYLIFYPLSRQRRVGKVVLIYHWKKKQSISCLVRYRCIYCVDI